MTPTVRPTSVSIVIPTCGRPEYLEVALASIAPQAAAAGAEVLVVDDAGDSATGRAQAERFGARYVAHTGERGLNVARNTGVERSDGELVVFVDDDVEVRPNWLGAFVRAAAEHPEAQVLTGPIRARLEGGGPRSCGREGPPITSLELGEQDTDRVKYAWGANMAVRRAALERVGGFDVRLEHGGDEQEWQDRLLAEQRRAGNERPIRYVAQAGLDHRRTGADARLRTLARGAHARGQAARRFDAWRGEQPSLTGELRTLVGCVGHVVRYRCPAGLVLVAHSAGRVRAAVGTRSSASAAGGAAGTSTSTSTSTSTEDFLSGASGTVGGVDGVRRVAADVLQEAREIATGRRTRLAGAARKEPARRRVLVLGVERPERHELAQAIRAELGRSRHAVEVWMTGPGEAGKFENLNRLLGEHPPDGYDWVLVIDDDVVLGRGFLDRFLFLAERVALDLAQPAHRAYSHAAWEVTRRVPGSVVRETEFVEIGPVTAFRRGTFQTLLPFPQLRMGWGLDLHWGALAREHGWRCGVVDAVAIRHSAAPAADAYSREAAIAEARAFLAEREYVRADEARRTLRTHRSW
ncbi:MAG TPA: glycosyltransferase [Solirubrobacteraceae bacterium]|nr:glycosyltransferase [Solirubrobacteraceae bacterium]